MTYAIKAQTNQDTTQHFFKKEFNSLEKFEAVVNLCGENRRRIGPFESLVITTRTDTISNFCKDFFLPTLTNCALKINNTAQKILMLCLTATADICTFPLRVITLIPRHLYNFYHSKENHPFYKYLLKNGVALASLNAGHVCLELRWPIKNQRNHDISWNTLNFMQLPEFESPTCKTYNIVPKPPFKLPF